MPLTDSPCWAASAASSLGPPGSFDGPGATLAPPEVMVWLTTSLSVADAYAAARALTVA